MSQPLSTIARRAMAAETVQMATARMAQRISHAEYVDWMGQMERKYPGCGWEAAAMQMHHAVTARRRSPQPGG